MSRLINKLFFALVSGGVLGCIFLGSSASALSGSEWDSGMIISDSQFFNSGTMSRSDIQNFLNSMVPTCDTWGTKQHSSGMSRADYGRSRGYAPPYTCLKDYFENPSTHQNNANGGGVTGGASAADIIKHAADTYNVSPKALLVLLQKEQTLVTDDWPWTLQYRSATGYGCPDTAPCDSEYYGFYNQVTQAAAQFQRYARNPANYRYKAFQSNYIQWNPNAGCGGSNVHIHNQATAGLYNYTPYQPNAAALNNLYGTGDGCSAYGNRNFWRMYNDWFGSTRHEEVFINFKSSVIGSGWQGQRSNSGITGTTGQSKTLEAIKINGYVQYSTYNGTSGWQPTVSQGMISGTSGLSRPIQAIKIAPTGNLANKYDIFYRAHVSNVGWLDWTKNGSVAGATGNASKNIEAIEIRLIVKNYTINGPTTTPYQNEGVVTPSAPVAASISSHVSNIGWQPGVTDSMISGTTEAKKSIEAVKVNLTNNTGLSGGIVYSAHVSAMGWQDIKSNNSTAGTTGQAKQMEAIRMALTGNLGENYDIWYRTHVQDRGWMSWAKNGQAAGSVGAAKRLEAFEVRIVPKNSVSLSQQNYLHNPQHQAAPADYGFSYSAHVSNIGWQLGVRPNATGGTTGQSKTLESIKFDTINSMFGGLNISCSAHVRNADWTTSVGIAGICGTTGQSKPIDGIRLGLAGDAASKFDIYYKVHLSYDGWQDWVKNGETAGLVDSGKPIEAIVVKLVPKV